MKNYFNVYLEFNHTKLYSVIENTVNNKGKGYVCVIDANVLTMAQKSTEYKSILNSSLINTCDGSSIALLAGWIYNEKYRALNGPEIFSSYIEKPYKHLLLGSTESILERINQRLLMKGITNPSIISLALPFNSVDEFNFIEIANEINRIKPEMIWVSLGAPKQEQFMYNLLPHINSGVMFGIGAAFNFYIGEITIPRLKFGRLRLIWLSRLFNEPKKLTKRLLPYVLLLPKLYWTEYKKNKTLLKLSKNLP
jgi:N-acetylglucosaminyldiphosphoundecaprenol N-acetyl-beta-D-mannosaminyltransferase